MSAPALEFTRDIACKSQQKSMWDLLSDTEQLNANLGNGAVRVEPLQGPSAARYAIALKLDGFNVAYEEEPYEWTYLQAFSVRRNFRKGPLDSLTLAFTFSPPAPTETGCLLQISLTLEPHRRWLSPLVRWRGKRNMDSLVAEVRRADEAAVSGMMDHWRRRRPLVNGTRLQQGIAAVRAAVGDTPAVHLEGYLQGCSDIQATGIRPYVLADSWGMDRVLVLRTLFAAAEANLLAPRWQIVCPSCRVPSETLPSADELREHGTCHFCDIGFDVSVDTNVEVLFTALPEVRSIAEGQYCIGGPARTPHVFVQMVLPARGSAVLLAPTLPGEYRVFVRGGAQCPLTVASGAPMKLIANAESLSRREPMRISPSGQLELRNASDQALHAKLETAAWASHAATSADVLRLTAGNKPIAL